MIYPVENSIFYDKDLYWEIEKWGIQLGIWIFSHGHFQIPIIFSFTRQITPTPSTNPTATTFATIVHTNINITILLLLKFLSDKMFLFCFFSSMLDETSQWSVYPAKVSLAESVPDIQ